jgi:DNA-binding IclR family transcriptional regulator
MTVAAPRRSTETLQSVTRAMTLLDVLGRHGEGATAKSLGVELGISLGAVYHLLATLRSAGYVVQDPLTQLFLLGPQVAQLHHAYLETLTPSTTSMTLLHGLQEAIGETMHLARLRGEQVVLIGIAPGSRRGAVPGGFIGLGGPAHSVAIGRAILAALPEPELERFLRAADLSGQGPFAASDPDWLRRELTVIQAAGYALDPGDRSTRVGGCLAVAVPRANGVAPDAISIMAPRSRFQRDVEGWIPRLTALAHAMSALELPGGTQTPRSDTLEGADVAEAMNLVMTHGTRKIRVRRARKRN